MKSLQWLQNVGCLKNRAKNLWFFTSCTFFCLKAPRRCTPFPVDSAILQRSDGLEIDACERSTCRVQKSAVVKTDGCRVCERTGVRIQSDAALYKKSEKSLSCLWVHYQKQKQTKKRGEGKIRHEMTPSPNSQFNCSKTTEKSQYSEYKPLNTVRLPHAPASSVYTHIVYTHTHTHTHTHTKTKILRCVTVKFGITYWLMLLRLNNCKIHQTGQYQLYEKTLNKKGKGTWEDTVPIVVLVLMMGPQ